MNAHSINVLLTPKLRIENKQTSRTYVYGCGEPVKKNPESEKVWPFVLV